MDLTIKQQEGLDIAVARYREGKRFTVISGYAGTGKSTLVQHIIAALQVPQEDVVYCAYTGKATLVLSSKGCKNTSTLHKLLYRARLNPATGRYSFFPRSDFEYPYKIVVVDEVSMLSMEMWDLLKSHSAYILALGDPGQLGPVKGDNDSGLLKSPHVFLDEIMRQAEDNEIIKLSMNIRKGEPLRNYKGQHIQVINSNEVSTGMLLWADQVLCAKNDTRFKLNEQMRKLAGHGQEPQIGDKVICLKNYWDIMSADEGTPLVNGTIGYITDVVKIPNPMLKCDVLKMSFISELGEHFNNLTVDYKLMTQNQPSLTWQEFRNLTKYLGNQIQMPLEFAFGYAITTWKAQGSEWDNILLFEENFPFIAEEKKRYLYTGITRASQKLVVVKK